jgi:hypothetical protein
MSSGPDPFDFATFAGSSGLTDLADLTELNAQFGAGSPRPGESFDSFVRGASVGLNLSCVSRMKPGELEETVRGAQKRKILCRRFEGVGGGKSRARTLAEAISRGAPILTESAKQTLRIRLRSVMWQSLTSVDTRPHLGRAGTFGLELSLIVSEFKSSRN